VFPPILLDVPPFPQSRDLLAPKKVDALRRTIPLCDLNLCRTLDSKARRSLVREFLYLSGGYEKGNWNWGGNSRTTAALLWPAAWDYFSKQFRPEQVQEVRQRLKLHTSVLAFLNAGAT
jgi:hypothetical protein